MKIFSVAKMIVLRSIRDVNVMLIMCAMPLLIIMVLGMAFDSIMGSDGDIMLDEMHVTYNVVGEESQLTDGIEMMMTELISEESTYTRQDDVEAQLEKVKSVSITSHITIDETEGTITLYKNNRVNTSSSIVETALRSYAARHNTIVEIAKVNPMAIADILEGYGNEEYIHKIGVNKKYQPSAMDYYGVAMVALFVLYGFLTPLEEVIIDRKQGLTRRISTTSVKPVEKFLGNVLGYVTVSVIRSTIVIVISALAFGVNWGDAPLYPFLLLFTLTVTMTSFGMMLGEIFKNPSPAGSVGHIFIVVTAFFGGAYMVLENMGPIGNVGKYFSLIWWANTGITNQIYSNDYSYMNTAFIIFIALSALFLTIALVFMNRKEAYSNE